MRLSALSKFATTMGMRFWRVLPTRITRRQPIRLIGKGIHAISRRYGNRGQVEGTWFFRNIPLLTTISELVKKSQPASTPLRLCAIGCSSGAELLSLLWTLRQIAPGLRVEAIGVDISESAISKAKAGIFSANDFELRGEMPEKARLEIFDLEAGQLCVKPTFMENVRWILGDANDPRLLAQLCPQDVVLANNFLVHMRPSDAYSCALPLPGTVTPGGLFVCRGVDLSIRERIARELRLQPVRLRIEEIHDADFGLDALYRWPWKYDGLEPLDKSYPGWESRYAAIFRVPS